MNIPILLISLVLLAIGISVFAVRSMTNLSEADRVHYIGFVIGLAATIIGGLTLIGVVLFKVFNRYMPMSNSSFITILFIAVALLAAGITHLVYYDAIKDITNTQKIDVFETLAYVYTSIGAFFFGLSLNMETKAQLVQRFTPYVESTNARIASVRDKVGSSAFAQNLGAGLSKVKNTMARASVPLPPLPVV